MSEDFNGGDDGYDADDSYDDSDNDGVPDNEDSDNDNDGIPDDQERTDWFGNHVIEINGQQVTQMEDVFGNPVMLGDDREVVATVEPDGDIRMEDGPTYVNLDDESGWRDYRGTDGSTLTIKETMSGFGEMSISKTKDKVSDQSEIKSESTENNSWSANVELGGDQILGSEMNSQNRTVNNQSGQTSTSESSLWGLIKKLATSYWRWLND